MMLREQGRSPKIAQLKSAKRNLMRMPETVLHSKVTIKSSVLDKA